MKTQSYKPGDFIANGDTANDLIREYELALGDSPGEFIANIDTANEELERLSKRLAGSTAKLASQVASRASNLKPPVATFQREELPTFKVGTGMSRLTAAIKKSQP